MATVSEIYINPDSQLSNNDINIGRCQLGLCVRINIPNGTVSLNNIWTATGLPGGLKPNTYVFVNNNVGNCDILLPTIGVLNTQASFGHEIQIYNDNTSTGTITIQNSATVVISVVAIGSGIIIRAANSTNIWRVIASSSATVASALPNVEGIVYARTQSNIVTRNTALGFNATLNIGAGTSNTIIGYEAGLGLTSGSTNTFIGRDAGRSISTQSNMVIIGGNCHANATNTTLNLIIGTNCFNTTSGTQFNGNTIIGNSIMPNNVVIGPFQRNTVIGFQTLNTPPLSMFDTILIGNSIGNSGTFTADDAIVIGANCCGAAAPGANICILGAASALIFSGNNLTSLGQNNVQSLTNGDSNITIGTSVDIVGNLSNNILIGDNSSTGFAGCITLGHGINPTNVNQFILGSTATNPINEFYWIAAAAANYNIPAATNALSINTPNGRIGIAPSSRRYKENIIPLNELDEFKSLDIMNIIPVNFNYKNDENKYKHIGLIAEDVDKAGFKCLVNYIPNVKKTTIKRVVKNPPKIKTIKDENGNDIEIKLPQKDTIKNELVDELDENGNPVKIDNDYDDICPDNVNYQMLSVILLKELQQLRKEFNEFKSSFKK